jgi:hypothetical protein
VIADCKKSPPHQNQNENNDIIQLIIEVIKEINIHKRNKFQTILHQLLLVKLTDL